MVNFLWTLHQDELQSSAEGYIDVIQHEKVYSTIILANITFFLILYYGKGFGEIDEFVENKNTEEKKPLIEKEDDDILTRTPTMKVRKRKKKNL